MRKGERINNRKFYIVNTPHRKNPKKEIQLPKRSTKNSAGYDFTTPISFTIKPNEKFLVWTDIKCNMNSNDVLELYVRSSIGIKKQLMLANVTGIIDSDYFENKSNDGNIGICLFNYGDKIVEIKAGEAIAQGIFKNYLTTNDDECDVERIGGIGSTN